MLNTLDEKTNFDQLNGEFNPLQAQNFAKRYKICFHQPNTKSGFSATLFYDTQKDIFIASFRGTEGILSMDVIQDIALSLNGNIQWLALFDFLKEVDQIIKLYNKRIIFVGHSLGGYLAQMALIYCDEKYKDELLFSPSEVYTFNAPSIYGWNFPNIVINPNTIKILLDFLDKNIVDISSKLTHIYDSGGINIIASAQYGSHNRLPIYTGKDSHSIIPLTQTLYFYSYLLELDSNYNKVKDKSFSECIEYLNTFNKNLETYTNTFILAKINKGNKTQYNLNTLQSSPIFVTAAINNLLGEAPEEIWYLSFILSLINSKIYNTIALRQDENKYNHPTIPKESIIDFITTLSNDGYYMSILDKEYFAKIRKKCDYINNINNVGYKACLAEYRNFIIINKNNQTIENKDNLGSIYGYNSSVYRAVHNKWCETSLGSHCKIIQGLYYGGKATMIAVKGS